MKISPTSLLTGPLACVALGCQPQPTETAAPPAPTTSLPPAVASVAVSPTVAQRFSPIISGHWVSAEYLEEVARTRSPEKASTHPLPAPASLTISPFASQQDSVQVGASYGLHEGGSLTLWLRTNGRADALPIKPDYSDRAGTFRQLSYHITAGDTTLFIESRHRKTYQLLHQVAYRRTGRPTTASDLEAAVNLGVNKLLLARQYHGTDSLGQPVQARFALDGTVDGLPFKKYVIQTDFTGPTPGDAIYFDLYTKRQQVLGASFGRDTLRLYTLHSAVGVPPGGTDTTEFFTWGRLRYQLIRTRQP